MTTLKKQILCVGLETGSQPGWEHQIASLHPHWEVTFCGTNQRAWQILSRRGFDAVVAQSNPPAMDGLQLLDKVQALCPEACRLLISDVNERSSIVKCAGVAHGWLPFPLDPELLRQTLDRNFGLALWLSNPTVRSLVSRMRRIPSHPQLYLHVVRALQSPHADVEEIANRISEDLAMTAKLLQLANSASLGLRVKVTSVQEAISFLGLETTRSLILLAHAFSGCESKSMGVSVESLWRHSLATGALARCIARAEGSPPDVADECFLSGLLHDIGKLLLSVNLGAEYEAVAALARQRKVPLWQMELEHFGATHGEIGAELLAIWNLPLAVVEALALHHYPSKLVSRTFGPLVAAHAANAIEHQLSSADDSAPGAELDLIYLADLGLAERIPVWQDACREIVASPLPL